MLLAAAKQPSTAATAAGATTGKLACAALAQSIGSTPAIDGDHGSCVGGGRCEGCNSGNGGDTGVLLGEIASSASPPSIYTAAGEGVSQGRDVLEVSKRACTFVDSHSGSRLCDGDLDGTEGCNGGGGGGGGSGCGDGRLQQNVAGDVSCCSEYARGDGCSGRDGDDGTEGDGGGSSGGGCQNDEKVSCFLHDPEASSRAAALDDTLDDSHSYVAGGAGYSSGGGSGDGGGLLCETGRFPVNQKVKVTTVGLVPCPPPSPLEQTLAPPKTDQGAYPSAALTLGMPALEKSPGRAVSDDGYSNQLKAAAGGLGRSWSPKKATLPVTMVTDGCNDKAVACPLGDSDDTNHPIGVFTSACRPNAETWSLSYPLPPEQPEEIVSVTLGFFSAHPGCDPVTGRDSDGATGLGATICGGGGRSEP
jgi:hypothetical protein